MSPEVLKEYLVVIKEMIVQPIYAAYYRRVMAANLVGTFIGIGCFLLFGLCLWQFIGLVRKLATCGSRGMADVDGLLMGTYAVVGFAAFVATVSLLPQSIVNLLSPDYRVIELLLLTLR